MACVVVLTGERGIGKTTICGETVALARARGCECGGILTRTHGADRHVEDVRSGEVRRLTARLDAESGVVQGRFRFDRSALRWASAVVAGSVPCDLLVIDEIGPLEVERDRGWAAAFDVLHGGGFRLAIAVIRPELVTPAQLRLPVSARAVVTATRENRDRLPAVLMEMLERQA